MAKLNFLKEEIDNIKSKVYFTKEEKEVLELWLIDESVTKTALEIHKSERTVSRRRESILKKILKVI